MRDYNRNSRSGGRRSGGGDFRRRDSGPREMHNAVCDECGKDCEVPFRPSGDKPIYCSSCFEGKGERSSRRSSGRSDFGKRDDTNKQLFEQLSSLSAKIDRILEALKVGVEEKPVPKKTEAKKVIEKVTVKDEQVEKKKSKKKVAKKSSKKDKQSSK